MLRGDEVYLRRLESGDLEHCHSWINDPSIFTIMGVFGPRSYAEQLSWFESLVGSRTNLVFALCRVEDDLHIGNVSLFDIDYISRNAGLTVFIAEEAHRGEGYGTEAVSLLCEYAFGYLNLHKVYCKTDNAVAGKLYESLGFKQEGVLRAQTYRDGAYMDKLLYGVLRSEFQACS